MLTERTPPKRATAPASLTMPPRSRLRSRPSCSASSTTHQVRQHRFRQRHDGGHTLHPAPGFRAGAECRGCGALHAVPPARRSNAKFQPSTCACTCSVAMNGRDCSSAGFSLALQPWAVQSQSNHAGPGLQAALSSCGRTCGTERAAAPACQSAPSSPPSLSASTSAT